MLWRWLGRLPARRATDPFSPYSRRAELFNALVFLNGRSRTTDGGVRVGDGAAGNCCVVMVTRKYEPQSCAPLASSRARHQHARDISRLMSAA